MNLRSLLRTPPPPHAFAAEPARLLYGRLTRRRDGIERLEAEPLPESWFQLGPVGVLQVDRQALAQSLATLKEKLPGLPARASLVIPDNWVRSIVLDLEAVPRRREEADEVVRWRLKRVLPCRPDEVRLDLVPTGSNGRTLVTLALERPLAAVEETFAAAGVQLGRLEPMSLALTALLPRLGVPVLMTVVGERALQIVLVAAGRPVLVRQKSVPAGGGQLADFVVRELGRTIAHARQHEVPAGAIEVWVAAARPELADDVAAWSVGQDGVAVRRLQVADERLPAHLAGRGSVWAWSLLATAWKGEA